MTTGMDSFEGRRAETRRFLGLVWGGRVLSGDLSMCFAPYFNSIRLDSNDLDAAAGEMAKSSFVEESVYLNTCLLSVTSRNNGGRGTADDAVMAPGMWADVDFLSPVHASDQLPPDLDQAMELCLAMTLPPTLVIDSGHGLYPWWLLDKPWDISDAEERGRARRLADAVQAALAQLSRERGWELDATSDLARVLRPPGTINKKLEGDHRPVRIVAEGGMRYSVEKLIETWGGFMRPSKAPSPPLAERITVGQRTHAITSIAGALRRRNAAVEAALAAAHAENEVACDPPLPEEKVTQTVLGIYQRYDPKESLNGNGKAADEAVSAPSRLSEVTPRRTGWLWPPFFPLGKMVIHAGEPGMMKSSLDVALAAAITTGTGFAEGREPQHVVFLNYEDDDEDGLVPRLIVAGADLSYCHSVPDAEKNPIGLIKLVHSVRPVAAFVDPFGSWAEEAENTGVETQVRRALKPLRQLARSSGAMVKVNCHPNKQNSLSDALYRIAGSLGGMVGYARVVLASKRDEGNFIAGIVKSNIGPDEVGLEYLPRFVPLELDGGVANYPRVVFGSIVSIERKNFFATEKEEKPTKAALAAEEIKKILADGPRLTKEVKALLRDRFGQNAIEYGALIAGVETRGQGKGARWALSGGTLGGATLSTPSVTLDLTNSVHSVAPLLVPPETEDGLV